MTRKGMIVTKGANEILDNNDADFFNSQSLEEIAKRDKIKKFVTLENFLDGIEFDEIDFEGFLEFISQERKRSRDDFRY